MLETWVQPLGWEDPLEEGMATPLFLPWECPQTEEPGGLQSIGCKELDITEQLNIADFPQKANAISFPECPPPQISGYHNFFGQEKIFIDHFLSLNIL